MLNNEELEKILEEAAKTKKIELEVLDKFNLEDNDLKNIYYFLSKNNIEIILENNEKEYEIAGDSYIEDPLKLYLKQISKYPVLTPQEEKALFISYKNGDEKARIKLIESNLKLVVSVAKQYRNRIYGSVMDFLDIIQDGNDGLFIAIERFDLSRGNKFSTYAVYWIRESILRKIAKFKRTIRIPINKSEILDKMRRYEDRNYCEYGVLPTKEEYLMYLGISEQEFDKLICISEGILSLDITSKDDDVCFLKESIRDNSSVSEQAINKILAEELLLEAKNILNERAYEIILLRNGFYNNKVYTLEEVGKICGVSKQRVKQIEQESIAKLKRILLYHEKIKQYTYKNNKKK